MLGHAEVVWFRSALSGRGGDHFVVVTPSPVEALEGRPSFLCAAPVRSGGRPVGVLVTHFDWCPRRRGS